MAIFFMNFETSDKINNKINNKINSEEAKLLKQAKNGDSKAFSELLKSHLPMIYNIAYRMSGNAEDASDMTQEAMIKLFKNLESFNFQSKFSTWVYRVATNACLDEIKKQKRHSNVLSIDNEKETEEGALQFEIEDDAPTPDVSLEKREVRELVAAALTRLSAEHRAVLVLRDIKGMSYEETARILNCGEGTVKSRLSRARKKLKEVLENEFKIDGTYFKD